MLRDTRTALTSFRACSSWLNSSSPGTHMLICYGSMTPRGAACVAWLLQCGLHCFFRKLFATYTWHCQTWPSICFVLTFGKQVHRNMKHQCSMRRLTITGGSEKDVRVSRIMDCRFGVIKSHVSANNKKIYVAWLMCHVYKFMCYSFVELKLKINTR